jgi:hypothetical protein
MKQTAVGWLVDKLTNGHYLDEGMKQDIINQAKEKEEKQSQDYAEFCINCDRRNYPILDFESYLKLKDNGKSNI